MISISGVVAAAHGYCQIQNSALAYFGAADCGNAQRRKNTDELRECIGAVGGSFYI